jgi:hypothetical protein
MEDFFPYNFAPQLCISQSIVTKWPFNQVCD